MHNNNAFTLTEMLITIVIIGVISALTIPSLITKYQKQVTVTKLKVVYEELSKATNMSMIKNGPIKNWNIPNPGWNRNQTCNVSEQFFSTYFKPYINIAKNCSCASEECWANRYLAVNGATYQVK